MAELAAQGVQLSAPLADRVAQRVDRPLGFVDSPAKAYPFLRDDGGLGGLGSPAAVARAARRSRAKHAGNFTPTSPGFGNGNGNGNGNFSPAAIALRAPIAAAVAAHGTVGTSSSSSSSSTSGRLFASPPPQAREYFTDMKSSDFFSAESMAYGGKAAPHATNNGSRTARALQPSTDAAYANGGGPLSELPLNAQASARAALVSAPKRYENAQKSNCVL